MHIFCICHSRVKIASRRSTRIILTRMPELMRSGHLCGEISFIILNVPLPIRHIGHGDEATGGREYCRQRDQIWFESRHVPLR